MAFGLLCLSRSKRVGANPGRDLRRGMALALGTALDPKRLLSLKYGAQSGADGGRARPRNGQVDVLPHRLGLAAIPQLVNFL